MFERCRFANDDALEKRIQWIQNATSLKNHRLNRQKKMRSFLVCLLMQGRFTHSAYSSKMVLITKDPIPRIKLASLVKTIYKIFKTVCAFSLVDRCV